MALLVVVAVPGAMQDWTSLYSRLSESGGTLLLFQFEEQACSHLAKGQTLEVCGKYQNI